MNNPLDKSAFDIAYQGGVNAYNVSKELAKKYQDQGDRSKVQQVLDNHKKGGGNTSFSDSISTMLSIQNDNIRNSGIHALEQIYKQEQEDLKKTKQTTALKKHNIPPEFADLPTGVQPRAYDTAALQSYEDNGNFGQYNPNQQPNNGYQNPNQDFQSPHMQNLNTPNPNQPQNPNQVNQPDPTNKYDLSAKSQEDLYKMLNNPYSRRQAQSEITRRENIKKNEVQTNQQALKDTNKFRQQLLDNSENASKMIHNSKMQLNLLGKGDIDSPLAVWFAEHLPSAIGNQLLSTNTQLYKAGLFADFGIVKQMFPGQIRVKEIELAEDKLATLDKSHEAKSEIHKRNIQNLEVDNIKLRAAEKIEEESPGMSLLQLSGAIREESQPEIDK